MHFHPDDHLYVGDLVSFEVIPPEGFDASGREVMISWNNAGLGSSVFELFGVEKRTQATFWWIWDTQELEPGEYSLTFTILPQGHEWQETFNLRTQDRVPYPEPAAHWAVARTDCCELHYITGTAAERDLEALEELMERQADEAERRMGAEFNETLSITLLPRVLGHGGFMGYVSYPDSRYSGGDFEQILLHEIIHALDLQMEGDIRTQFFLEGLAVYVSGGHFQQEPLLIRASALLDLEWYIPLPTLVGKFYFQQHEISYLEAGALVAYMVQEYGWEEFNAFYRDIHPHPDGRIVSSVDAALLIHFAITLQELEDEFLSFLQTQEVTPDIRDDLRLTVLYFDSVRRYQQALDPSAYFMTLWMPDSSLMRERGIVADYLRHPSGLGNHAFEYLLMRADQHLQNGEYQQTEQVLNWVNALLALVE